MHNNIFLLFILMASIALYSCNKKAYNSFNNSTSYHYTAAESGNDIPCPDFDDRKRSTKKMSLIEPEQISEKNTVPQMSNITPISGIGEKKTTKKEIIKAGIKKIREIHSFNKTNKEVPVRLTRALWLLIPGAVLMTAGILLQSYFYTELFTILFAIIFVIGVFALIRYLADPKGKKNMN